MYINVPTFSLTEERENTSWGLQRRKCRPYAAKKAERVEEEAAKQGTTELKPTSTGRQTSEARSSKPTPLREYFRTSETETYYHLHVVFRYAVL